MWPIPWPDEAHFADISRTLLSEGTVATRLFAGEIPGMEQHAYWTPPLYYLVLALWFVVGQALWWQRALSLVSAVAALAAVWRLSYRVNVDGLGIVAMSGDDGWFRRGMGDAKARARAVSALAVAYCCVDVVFLRGALVGRMDMLCLALGLWAVVFAQRSVVAWPYPGPQAAAGLLAGLSVCTHPLGLTAAVGTFLWSPRWRTLLAFIIPVGLWGAWVWSGDPALFLEQWRLQFARKDGVDYGLLAVWWRFVNQYQPSQVVPVALWLLGIVGCGVVNGWRFSRWAAWQAITFGAAFCGGEMWYPLWLVPVSIVPAVRWISRRGQWMPYSVGVLSCIAVLSGHAILRQVAQAPPIPASYATLRPNAKEVGGGAYPVSTYKAEEIETDVLYVDNWIPDPYWFVDPLLILRYPAPWEPKEKRQ